jgi:hypothetical protein
MNANLRRLGGPPCDDSARRDARIAELESRTGATAQRRWTPTLQGVNVNVNNVTSPDHHWG